ncbi:MAG: dCMP deaminase [Nocardiopsis sp. BM-2018]|uniref:Diaminohydroxyphosphoribosylaminopyrimidine deaminase/5-amino-6-(5-phosphoribosylamino)uracil reductase n=1 Tax=Nocardiopsis metallicus TaxID=179819 RepID=A0A840VZJ1_9ACTN|nr:dCMP deaminase [Nocardiopsis metallicus]MBB5489134.1 diaminohydroxyphosphoribosylaminopyrimidine deaminase/5-amino-6-(5-phosphoribosylamino)uracil reductase [Nocardiopsis metallicus]QRN79350.1 MAG: dCMP deaminase [Nocardiopsis sp. BM-2018]
MDPTGRTGGPRPAEGAPDGFWLTAAIQLSRSCPPSSTAFSVGAVVVSAQGQLLAEGYSRRDDPHDHAEEVAFRGIDPEDPRLREATVYTSLEPCSSRASRPRSCTELILSTPVPRVVLAWREPALFVDCDGAERLTAAGRTVVERPDLAEGVREVNAHLLN